MDLLILRRILALFWWNDCMLVELNGHSWYEVFLFTESACSSHALNDIYPTWHAVFSDIDFTWKKHFCKLYIYQLALILSEHIFFAYYKNKIHYIFFTCHLFHGNHIWNFLMWDSFKCSSHEINVENNFQVA